MSSTAQSAAIDPFVSDLPALAVDLVQRALRAGASDAVAGISEGDEFSVTVRMGEVETLEESGSRSLGLRVFLGQSSASASTSDLTPDGLDRLIASAMALVRITEPDPCAGLAEAAEMGAFGGDLRLYFDDVYALPVAERIALARRAEDAALAADPRIRNSAGGSFSAATARRILTNSRGFLGDYRSSHCGLSVVPIAMDEQGAMQRESWWSSVRRLSDLESPEAIGREAARRALRMLGARRVATQQVPIVFAPEAARTLLGHLFEAASGDAIWRSASFLNGHLGEVIAAPELTVLDDHTLLLPNGVGGFGSRPFDGDALPTRATTLVENGVLRTWLLNTYAARKLGMRSTGNASGGGIGAGNLYILPGSPSPEQILRSIPRGFYVTSLLGFGANLVTGDYSRGASGLWIEGGELTHAVEEVTIAGNLREMFRRIAAIGNDLEFRGSVASPTLCIEGMTVAGA
jgi:PmbA protein